jgi:hypothetical protein
MCFHCWFVTQAPHKQAYPTCALPPSFTNLTTSRTPLFILTPSSLDKVKMRNRKEPTSHDASAPSAKKQAANVNGTRSHPGAGKSWKDGIEAAADTATMTTRVARKQKRGAISQLTDQVSKRQRLSTELRCLKSNAELRARLRAEEEEAARPMSVGSLEKSSIQH